jgi:hypothetical protein
MEILHTVEVMPTWDAGELGAVLDAIRDAEPSSRLDWDLDAGEEWARVLNADEVDALIRAPTSVARAHRFAFVRSGSSAAESLLAILRRNEAHTVELEDFELPSLSIDPDDLVAFVGRAMPQAHVFDPARFSANDLWFVSV